MYRKRVVDGSTYFIQHGLLENAIVPRPLEVEMGFAIRVNTESSRGGADVQNESSWN